MKPIRSVFVPSSHVYFDYLTETMRDTGIEFRHVEVDWGFYLPNLTDELIELRPDIVHLHWPEAMMTRDGVRGDTGEVVLDVFLALRKLQRAGIRLVWTMHNLVPHERESPDAEEAVYRLFAAVVDGVSHHSHWGKAKALETYAYRGVHAIVRHGYRPESARLMPSRTDARKALDIPHDLRVYLWFGGIRAGKRLEVLVEAMKRRDDPSELLLLPTRGDPQHVEEIRSQAAGARTIRLLEHERFVPDETLRLYAAACDLLVFCHGDRHLTSGGPHLSQDFLRPQITLESPYAREVLGDGGIYVPNKGDRVKNLCRAMDSITPDLLEEKTRLIKAGRKAFAWRKSGLATAKLYRKVLASPPMIDLEERP